MEIQQGLSAIDTPMVIWTQRSAYLHKKTGWRGLFEKTPIDPYYQLPFGGMDIVEETISMVMGPSDENVMVMSRILTPLEQAEHKTTKAMIAIPMEEVHGFVLKQPFEKVKTWQTFGGYTRYAPQPSSIHVDTGGGVLVYIAQHLDHTGAEMPRLRRILQESFVDHEVVRAWQAKFGRRPRDTYDPLNPKWPFGSDIKTIVPTTPDDPDDVV